VIQTGMHSEHPPAPRMRAPRSRPAGVVFAAERSPTTSRLFAPLRRLRVDRDQPLPSRARGGGGGALKAIIRSGLFLCGGMRWDRRGLGPKRGNHRAAQCTLRSSPSPCSQEHSQAAREIKEATSAVETLADICPDRCTTLPFARCHLHAHLARPELGTARWRHGLLSCCRRAGPTSQASSASPRRGIAGGKMGRETNSASASWKTVLASSHGRPQAPLRAFHCLPAGAHAETSTTHCGRCSTRRAPARQFRDRRGRRQNHRALVEPHHVIRLVPEDGNRPHSIISYRGARRLASEKAAPTRPPGRPAWPCPS